MPGQTVCQSGTRYGDLFWFDREREIAGRNGFCAIFHEISDPDQSIMIADRICLAADRAGRRLVGLRRDKAAMAVAAETPAMMGTGEIILTDEAQTQPQSLVRASVLGCVNFALRIPPEDDRISQMAYAADGSGKKII
ncbi:MAG: hypothetical protein LKH33_01470 [Acetobacter sp.]|nr:hypothetical protein [Acetobacter sp.]MCH4062277.1 hypothetical protein [Acetobacter sp.]MCH4088876.1 hypothetical protein [Acetobacter sp.]MCI1292779.1 hypothetical protein [Acetobacter sp.]MCI1319120.1 hypothetical protein [Acetobacter sp.]